MIKFNYKSVGFAFFAVVFVAVFIVLSLVLNSSLASAATGDLIWQRHLGPPSAEMGGEIESVADGADSVIFLGTCSREGIDLGGGVIQPPNSYKSICLAKYNSDNGYLWGKRISSTFNAYANGVDVDEGNNAVIGGYFIGTINLGGTDLSTVKVGIFDESPDLYVVKYNSNGEHVWSKKFGGTGSNSEKIIDIKTSPNGDIVIIGMFKGEFSFPGGSVLRSTGPYENLFIAKLNSNGDHLWSKAITGSDYMLFHSDSLEVDGSGNIFIIGQFRGNINFNGQQFSTTGGDDIFLARLSSSGDVSWIKTYGNTEGNTDDGYSIAVDENSIVIGTLVGIVNGGSINFSGGIVTASANYELAVLVKLDLNGNFVWAKSYRMVYNPPAAEFIGLYYLSIDSYGNILITGRLNGGLWIKENRPDLLKLVGGNDAFIALFSSSGSGIWGIVPTGTGNNEGASAVFDSINDIIVTGSFGQSANFGGDIMSTTSSISHSYLVKLDGTVGTVQSPAIPTGLTATAVSSSQINLAWTDNSNNEQGFKIERSGDGVNFNQIATTTSSSYSNTGLSASTTYSYRVRAYNSAGDSAYSNTASATTQLGGCAKHPADTNSDNKVSISEANSYMNCWLNNCDGRSIQYAANAMHIWLTSVDGSYCI